MSYAIVKHHLMDITVIIRKTLVYSLVTGVMAAIMVFVAMVSARVGAGGGGHPWVSLALTACLITAVFHPLQLKIQAFVDKHLFRDWADRDIVREVASGFSHELKSPLAGLSMQAQLAMAELEDIEKGSGSLRQAIPKIKQELRYILSQAMDAARRIEAVRGVAEPGRLQMEPVDMPAVIEGALSALDLLLGRSTVTVRREIPENLPPVQGYAKQLEIVFINLMKNALEAMETADAETRTTRTPLRGTGLLDGKQGGARGRGDTGKLILGAYEHNGAVRVSVKDTGEGIAAKDLARLFELNFSTKGRRGTGMGLYLSQQIVRAHGGSIEARSEPGKGTEFVVTLPKYTAASSAAA